MTSKVKLVKNPALSVAQEVVQALRHTYNKAHATDRPAQHQLLVQLVPLIRAWRAAAEPSGVGTFSHALYARRFAELTKFVERLAGTNGGFDYTSPDVDVAIRNIMDCSLPVPASTETTSIRVMWDTASKIRTAQLARLLVARREFLESLTPTQMALLREIGYIYAPR